jgi:hypothetical protein
MKSVALILSVLFTLNSYSQTKITGETFTKINILSSGKINLSQDAICSVTFSGDDKPGNGDVEFKNGTLIISGNLDEVLDITLPSLEEISIDGHGSVNGQNSFNAENLKLHIDGDGKINLNVTAKNITSVINGFGKITLTGTSQDADFSIPGSGKIDALELKTIRCNVKIDGLGKVMVDVVDELTTEIQGNGTVTYKSLPKSIKENVTGIGKVKSNSEDEVYIESIPDTTKLEFGKKQVLIIGKKDSTHLKKHKVKPIWAGFELGINSYLDNDASFSLSPGKENWELRNEKSVSVSINLLQKEIEIGHSNVWLFTGLGITWNNYRFDNNVVLENGDVTTARIDSSPGIVRLKSKLVSSYLMAPVMLEVFTSRNIKKAVHIGAGALVGVRLGSHTKEKIEIDGDVSKIKDHDDFNLNPFRYGFRVAIGYGKFNLFADYYASTLFKSDKGPTLYPVNAGITFVGF